MAGRDLRPLRPAGFPPAGRGNPAAATSPIPARGCPALTRGQAGFLSLELALVIPLVFLLVVMIFHGAVFARDVLAVQNAAREGARVAATTTSDAAVHAAVVEALDGRDPVRVTLDPPRRRAGQAVRVRVTLRSRAGVIGSDVTGHATARVEPGVG